MCKISIVIFSIILGGSLSSYAQIEEEPEQYSHWTAGIAIGEPFMFCNLTSFSANQTYWGISGGAFGGYQVNPILGFTFSFDYGMNKAGAHSYAFDRKLALDGTTYYLPTLPGTRFSEIHAKIRFFQLGVQAAFNLNRIIFRPSYPQRFTALLLPAVYLQNFHSTVMDKSGKEITDGSLNGGIDLGLGLELGMRGRINDQFDAQLSSGIVWTNNNTFDGVNNLSRAKDDYIWQTKLSLIYKINRKAKGEKDNILYATSAPEPLASDLAHTLAEAQKYEQQLNLRLKAFQDSLHASRPIRVVDTLYIIQKDSSTTPASSPLAGQEDWILRIIHKIQTEQPEIIKQVGYDTLIKQVIEAREEYAGYYTDEKIPAQAMEQRTSKYAIQIYAMTNPFPVSFFQGTPGIRVVRLLKDGLYRYLYAVYDSMEEARAVLPQVQQKYWDAFIREFDNYMIENALLLDIPTPAGAEKTKER